MTRTKHYSYSLYADAATAQHFDQLRFGGPIGQLIAETQRDALLAFLGEVAGREILDVGAGTGRASLELARRGARVTGVDASAEMLKVAEARAREEGLSAVFRVEDAHALGFPERSFDAAVCLRVIMHTPGWRQCLGELCRVTRDRIVFDYPARRSAAALQAGARRVAAACGLRTEAYRVFSDRAIDAAIAAHGFKVVRRTRQFVLPIAFHKLLASRAATVRIEGALDRVGLLRLFGSPVTALAIRCRS